MPYLCSEWGQRGFSACWRSSQRGSLSLHMVEAEGALLVLDIIAARLLIPALVCSRRDSTLLVILAAGILIRVLGESREVLLLPEILAAGFLISAMTKSRWYSPTAGDHSIRVPHLSTGWGQRGFHSCWRPRQQDSPSRPCAGAGDVLILLVTPAAEFPIPAPCERKEQPLLLEARAAGFLISALGEGRRCSPPAGGPVGRIPYVCHARGPGGSHPAGDPGSRIPYLCSVREQRRLPSCWGSRLQGSSSRRCARAEPWRSLDFGPDSGLGLVAQKRSGIK